MVGMNEELPSRFQREIERVSRWKAETLDREIGFALFDGYPWEDLTTITRTDDLGTEIWYDPFHEIIDGPLGGYPNFNQAKMLARVSIEMPKFPIGNHSH